MRRVVQGRLGETIPNRSINLAGRTTRSKTYFEHDTCL